MKIEKRKTHIISLIAAILVFLIIIILIGRKGWGEYFIFALIPLIYISAPLVVILIAFLSGMKSNEYYKSDIKAFFIFLLTILVLYFGLQYLDHLIYTYKQNNYKSEPIKEYSVSIIGEQEYDNMVDSIIISAIIDSKTYPAYLGVSSKINWKIDPKFCVNNKGTRFIGALIKQDSIMSSLGWLCGFKYQGEWQYFKRGAGLHYFNEHLDMDKSDTIPMAYLEQEAEKAILGGYLKKKSRWSDEYEINDRFFTNIFEGSGWYSIEKQVDNMEDSVAIESLWVETYMGAVWARESKILEIEAENQLWEDLLKDRKMMGYTFERGLKIDIHKEDFLNEDLKLIIAIDPCYNNQAYFWKFQASYLRALKSKGYEMLRYQIDQVPVEMEAIKLDIEMKIRELEELQKK